MESATNVENVSSSFGYADVNKAFTPDSVVEYHTVDKHIFGGRGLVATQDMSEVTFKMPTGPVKVPKDGAIK